VDDLRVYLEVNDRIPREEEEEPHDTAPGIGTEGVG
jgi:hypothetical protein